MNCEETAAQPPITAEKRQNKSARNGCFQLLRRRFYTATLLCYPRDIEVLPV